MSRGKGALFDSRLIGRARSASTTLKCSIERSVSRSIFLSRPAEIIQLPNIRLFSSPDIRIRRGYAFLDGPSASKHKTRYVPSARAISSERNGQLTCVDWKAKSYVGSFELHFSLEPRESDYRYRGYYCFERSNSCCQLQRIIYTISSSRNNRART